MRPRENPFRSEQIESLSFKVRGGGQWYAKLQRLNFRAAIVGPTGTGKTTLLEEIASILDLHGHRYFFQTLREESGSAARQAFFRSLSSLEPQTILVLDGYEQLSFLDRVRLRLQTAGLRGCIVTSHHRTFLRTLHKTTTSPRLLWELIRELKPDPLPSPSLLNALFLKHRGNLREVFRELYDVYAGPVSPLDLSLRASFSPQ